MWFLILLLLSATAYADIKKINDTSYEESVKVVVNLDTEKAALENEQVALERMTTRCDDEISRTQQRIIEHQERIDAGKNAGVYFTKKEEAVTRDIN